MVGGGGGGWIEVGVVGGGGGWGWGLYAILHSMCWVSTYMCVCISIMCVDVCMLTCVCAAQLVVKLLHNLLATPLYRM